MPCPVLVSLVSFNQESSRRGILVLRLITAFNRGHRHHERAPPPESSKCLSRTLTATSLSLWRAADVPPFNRALAHHSLQPPGGIAAFGSSLRGPPLSQRSTAAVSGSIHDVYTDPGDAARAIYASSRDPVRAATCGGVVPSTLASAGSAPPFEKLEDARNELRPGGDEERCGNVRVLRVRIGPALKQQSSYSVQPHSVKQTARQKEWWQTFFVH